MKTKEMVAFAKRVGATVSVPEEFAQTVPPEPIAFVANPDGRTSRQRSCAAGRRSAPRGALQRISSSGLQPLWVVVPVDRDNEELFRREGEKPLYFPSGRPRLRFANSEYSLEEDDTLHFGTGKPHRPQALGGRGTEIFPVAAADHPLIRSHL